MSSLVVITFDNPTEAVELRNEIRDLEHKGMANIEDSAVLVKDERGKINVIGEDDKTVVKGAVAGGTLGLLLAFIFPIAGIAIGAAGGALVGAAMDAGIDKKFVKQVSEELQPNSSAIFVIGNGVDVNATLAVLRQHTGKVYHTNLSSDLDESLRRAVHDTSTTNYNY